MSDLHKRNTDAMISHSKNVSEQLHALKEEVVRLNAKVQSITTELESIKKKAIMGAVKDQIEQTGHGGTA